MTVDRIHDSKSAVSDFTDRVADDASPNTVAAASDDPANAPQIGLSSALGGDDSAGLPSLHVGLPRPVTISFDPPAANSSLTGPAVTAPLAAATVTEEFFTGNFSAAPPSAGAGGLVDFDSRGNGGGGTGSGGATVSNGFVASWGASNAYGMTFVINWDRSTANAPAARGQNSRSLFPRPFREPNHDYAQCRVGRGRRPKDVFRRARRK